MSQPQIIEVVDLANSPYEAKRQKRRNKIYIRSVTGVIENIRRSIGGVLILLFIALPWLQFHGRQGILLDFVAQRFHLFGLTLWPQDLTLLAWLFIIAAFALFVVTAVWGRVWCGFMCPQTVFTFLFAWVEEKVEGARNKRIALDKQPLSASKIGKKSTKYMLWIGISLITATTFVGYFTPIRDLVADAVSLQISFWPAFYIALFALCTFVNAGWMREKMCTHMCPYSRFQSSMFDNDTLTVTYDSKRGEGRGPRSRRESKAQYQQKGLGDCIDCNLCVQVCPAGIDIRDGLQYECINCGACVDACNGVMSKMNYEKGLIAFTSQNQLNQAGCNTYTGAKTENKPSAKILGYSLALVLMCGLFAADLLTRTPLDIDVIRDRGALFRETNEGLVENVYTLVVMNKSQQSQQYKVEIEGMDVAYLLGAQSISVQENQMAHFPLSVAVDPQAIAKTVTSFSITVTDELNRSVTEELTFLYR